MSTDVGSRAASSSAPPLATTLLSAALLAVGSRPWALSAALAWVAFVPLFHALATSASRQRPLLAAGHGFLAAMAITSVAYEAALGVSGVAYAITVPVAALPFAAASAGAAWIAGRLGERSLWLVGPTLWCCAELVVRQEWLLGRFALPLAAFGYSQATTAAVHLASVGSVTAVSYAVLLVNGGLYALARWALAQRAARRAYPWAPAAAVAVVAVGVWLAARTAPRPLAPHDHDPALLTTVRVVQPNLPVSVRSAASAEEGLALELLRGLSALSGGVGAPTGQGAPWHTLEVWPEGIWPSRLRHGAQQANAASSGRASEALLEPAARALLASLAPTLLGAAAVTLPDGAPGNSAFVWDGAALFHVFDKRHLVPFVEDGLSSSSAPEVVALAGTLVSPLICYDVAFHATARAAARSGAELLAVLVDDTFAAGSDVPLQHLRVAVLRAVETGVWLAFASNGGPSAIVDPAGRIVQRSAAGVAAVLSATTRLGPGSTPYLRYGDWVGVTICLLAMGLAVAAGTRGGAHPTPPPT